MAVPFGEARGHIFRDDEEAEAGFLR